MKNLLSLGIAATLTGCTVHIGNSPTPAPVPQQSRYVAPAPRPAPEPEEQEPDRQQLFVDATSMCSKIQNNKDVPITCHLKNLGDDENRPGLWLMFKNLAGMSAHIKEIATYVAAPYCLATRDLPNIDSVIVAMLHDEKEYQIYSCNNREWSEWRSFDSDRREM